MREIDDGLIDVMVRRFAQCPSPMTGMLLEHFHGTVTRVDPAATAIPHRRPGYNLLIPSLWLDPDGQSRIVHLGSGSGSLLTCVLADNALDFLRLLAIGYEEICWSEDFAEPPQPREGDDGEVVNVAYRDWLRATFAVTIPATAFEVVRHPCDMGDLDTADPFCHWVNHLQDWH